MYRQYQDLQLFDVLFLSYTCHRNAIRSSCHLTSILELVPLMNLMTTGFITSSTNKTSAIFHILGRRVDYLDKNCINYYIVPRYRSYLR